MRGVFSEKTHRALLRPRSTAHRQERRRWGRFRPDLRAQLALQVGIGVASVVVFFLILRGYVVQEEVDRASRERLAVGQVLAGYVDAQLGDTLQQLARTAARVQTSSQAGTPALLEDLRFRLDQTAYGVFLLDAGGRPLGADPPELGQLGAELARRPEVAPELAAGRAVVSGVHSGPGGRAQFGMAVPTRLPWLPDAAGQPTAGTLGILVDPTNPRFGELVQASISLGVGTSAEVVDQFGTVVTSTERERTLLPGQFQALYANRIASHLSGWEVAVPTDGPNTGERFLVAFAPLQRAPWGLALAGPEAQVLAPIRRLDPPLVALVLASLAILVGLATLTARSVVDPVRELILAARRIARGDLETEVPRRGAGELHALSRALDEMRLGLREAERARAEVDRLKDEFVSSVSHELRTPLGYIKGYTTTLLRRDAEWDEEQVREFLRIIDESSDQLESLVDHLLDMSRISEGRLSVEPEPVALAPIARDVARNANVRTSAHRIKVQVPPDMPLVMADRGRIGQVLGNLVDNAIKYSPEGGPITISAAVTAEQAHVAVRDEGLGIPEDQLESVFDRFHRGSSALVRSTRGTGLGLPICRAIVEAHGGRIWAERPADGPGSVVHFTLPLAPAEAQPGADDAEDAAE